jgi:hypothetical protein
LAEFCRLPYSVFDHEVSYGEEAVGRGAWDYFVTKLHYYNIMLSQLYIIIEELIINSGNIFILG